MMRDDCGDRIYWLTEAEAGGVLNVGHDELAAMIQRGEFESVYRTRFGDFMIPVSEVEKYMRYSRILGGVLRVT